MAIRITGMNSGLDTDAMVQELVNAYNVKKDKYVGEQKKLSWKQDAWKEINSKIKALNTKVGNLRFSTAYNAKKTTASDTSKVSVIASSSATKGTQELYIDKLAKAAYLTGAKLSTADSSVKLSGSTKISELGGGYTPTSDDKIVLYKGNVDMDDAEAVEAASKQTLSLTADTTINDVVKFAQSAGYNASFDSGTGRIFISSKDSGEVNGFTLGGTAEALNALGLTAEGSHFVSAEDAKIRLNGAEFTSSSNTFSINGLTITAQGTTKDENGNDTAPISLNTDVDVDTIYNNIKSFIKEYTSVINQLDALYNADSADDYDMLTDEEKEAMSDDEIEKWESKIKSALLRRDSSINEVAEAMKSATIKSYTVDGTKYSLSSFGIETLSYFLAEDNEKNALHIDGDPDDEAVSGTTDKLKKMIASNPDAVSGFFTQLATTMYSSLQRLSRTSTLRSYGNFYDDKKLDEDYRNWEKKISDYEDYVADIEDKYYKQFTAMEKAMSDLNSQQTYISQLMG